MHTSFSTTNSLFYLAYKKWKNTYPPRSTAKTTSFIVTMKLTTEDVRLNKSCRHGGKSKPFAICHVWTNERCFLIVNIGVFMQTGCIFLVSLVSKCLLLLFRAIDRIPDIIILVHSYIHIPVPSITPD